MGDPRQVSAVMAVVTVDRHTDPTFRSHPRSCSIFRHVAVAPGPGFPLSPGDLVQRGKELCLVIAVRAEEVNVLWMATCT